MAAVVPARVLRCCCPSLFRREFGTFRKWAEKGEAWNREGEKVVSCELVLMPDDSHEDVV